MASQQNDGQPSNVPFNEPPPSYAEVLAGDLEPSAPQPPHSHSVPPPPPYQPGKVTGQTGVPSPFAEERQHYYDRVPQLYGAAPLVPPNARTIEITVPRGNCPRCGMANLEDRPDVALIICLILMAFLFTPLTLCCIPCAFGRVCPNCGYSNS